MIAGDAATQWHHLLSRSQILLSLCRIIASDYSHPVYSPPPSPRLRRQRAEYFGAVCLLPLPLAFCGQNSEVISREMAYNFPGVPATAMPPMGERRPISLIITPFFLHPHRSRIRRSVSSSMCNPQAWDQ